MSALAFLHFIDIIYSPNLKYKGNVHMGKKPWFEEHRPTVFNDLVLPDDVAMPQVSSFYDNGFVKGNILCYGGTGLGKTSLNEVLIHQIVKDQNDIFVLGKKVEDVVKLKRWLHQCPVGSKQKIVKIEEMDTMGKDAQLMLKDGLMEKHTHNTAFLATTNNIDKIDSAVMSRFNTKINFKNLPTEDVINRLQYILDKEKIEYTIDDLTTYVKANPKVGMRDMVNYIESASCSGFFGSKVPPTPKKAPRKSSPQAQTTEPTYTVIPSPWVAKMRPEPVIPVVTTEPTIPTRMLNKKQVLEFFGLAPNNPKRFEILDQLTSHPNQTNVNHNYREDEVADLINQLFPRGQ